jgi:hypothetical protein
MARIGITARAHELVLCKAAAVLSFEACWRCTQAARKSAGVMNFASSQHNSEGSEEDPHEAEQAPQSPEFPTHLFVTRQSV